MADLGIPSAYVRDKRTPPPSRPEAAAVLDRKSRVDPHAYGVIRAAAIPSTSLGSAGVCLGNTRALVACSKS